MLANATQMGTMKARRAVDRVMPRAPMPPRCRPQASIKSGLTPRGLQARLIRLLNRIPSSAHDQGTSAMVGEQLKQHRMPDLAVENDHALDARFERIDAGLDL